MEGRIGAGSGTIFNQEENTQVQLNNNNNIRAPLMEHPLEEEEEAEEADYEGAEGDGEVDEQKKDQEENGQSDHLDLERPKLDEGFFEIEAIRRKRIRKGKLQYLIKWRGWPEEANTWEPLKNLKSCSDIIDAFEESFRSGKHQSARGRKRKGESIQTQSKKKEQQRMAAATDTDGQPLHVPLDDSAFAENPAPLRYVNAMGIKQASANCLANQSSKIQKGEVEDNDLDMKLAEFKGMDKFATNFQEGNASEANGLAKVHDVEPTQINHCTGAKRRKSGSVKRFKQDSASNKPYNAGNMNTGMAEPVGFENSSINGANSNFKIAPGNSKEAYAITCIINPVDYSTSISNNVQDVLVTFKALRSDGKEVMVDNKYLKAHNPHLLINFYEQHLRYWA